MRWLNVIPVIVIVSLVSIIMFCMISIENRSREINSELYNLETIVFGDGAKPRAEIDSYPGRIRAISLKVGEK